MSSLGESSYDSMNYEPKVSLLVAKEENKPLCVSNRKRITAEPVLELVVKKETKEVHEVTHELVEFLHDNSLQGDMTNFHLDTATPPPCDNKANINVALERTILKEEVKLSPSLENEPSNCGKKTTKLILNLVVKKDFEELSGVTYQSVVKKEPEEPISVTSELVEFFHDDLPQADKNNICFNTVAPTPLDDRSSVQNVLGKTIVDDKVKLLFSLENESSNTSQKATEPVLNLVLKRDFEEQCGVTSLSDVKRKSEGPVVTTCKSAKFLHINSLPNNIASAGFSDNIDPASLGDSLNKPSKKSKMCTDLSEIKLVDVSVQLVDLFSDSLRKLGKAHSNSPSCLCMYCRNKFTCSDCSPSTSKTVVNDRSLRNLNLKERSGKSDCKKSFRHHQNSKKSGHGPYLKNSHSSERPYECELCSAKFKTKRCIKIHMRVHSTERPYKCKYCSAKFKSSTNLNTHLRLHTNQKPFKCKQCSAKFSQSNALKSHMRVHSREKPFKCDQCFKKFAQSSTLYVHLRIHTGERPYTCKVCQAKFKTSSYLKVHLRIHSGDKPYMCKQCSARFTCISNLQMHSRVHTGEKLFSCAHCAARFTRKYSLTIHLKAHCSKNLSFECSQKSKNR